MKKRNTPYGYSYVNGRLVVNKDEAKVICNIFSDYLKGMSLSKIASKLNNNEIEYFGGVTGWNKSRISRILEDIRYLGTDEYERIVSDDIYENANKIKNVKNNQKSVDRSLPIYNLKIPVLCSQCNTPLKRKYSGRCRCKTSWVSDNHLCNRGIKISDEDLLNQITGLINRCINDIDKITYDENITVNNDLIKSNNEVQRLLYCTHTNEEDILNSIYENAKLNYSAIGNDKFDTDRVKVVLRKTRPLSKFSMEIFRATVKAIILHPNAVVDILLKNNQTIEGEKYDC